MKQFITKIQLLKRLKHHRIVELIGSYTGPKYIGLNMPSVAEMDINVYLRRANDSSLPELRTFFTCLATALGYLREENVRHKDIKPSNISVELSCLQTLARRSTLQTRVAAPLRAW